MPVTVSAVFADEHAARSALAALRTRGYRAALGHQQPAAPVQQQPTAQKGSFCANCGEQLTPGAKFCPNCGQKQETANVCPACGQKVQPGAKFCANCGQKL